jgi:hypothetical protein
MYDIFMASLTRMYADPDLFPEFKEVVSKLPFLRSVFVHIILDLTAHTYLHPAKRTSFRLIPRPYSQELA